MPPGVDRMVFFQLLSGHRTVVDAAARNRASPPHQSSYETRSHRSHSNELLCRRFAEAENIPVGILDVEVPTRPRPFFQRLGDSCPARPEFVMEARHTNHTEVRVEMFMPLPMCSIGELSGRT